jgi:hypothetical protein
MRVSEIFRLAIIFLVYSLLLSCGKSKESDLLIETTLNRLFIEIMLENSRNKIYKFQAFSAYEPITSLDDQLEKSIVKKFNRGEIQFHSEVKVLPSGYINEGDVSPLITWLWNDKKYILYNTGDIASKDKQMNRHADQ